MTAVLRPRAMNQKVAVSMVFVAALFMNIMDVTIVNVALPKIGIDLHVGPTAVSGVSIGYLVSLAVVIPASGWLGDRLGSRKVLLAAVVVFTVASALCGIAQDFTQLVGFRILQGIGGGMMVPVGMAMLFRVFPPQQRVRASAILVIPTAFAPALGPVLGGLLTTELSWRWVFFVNLPIGVLAVIFGLLFVRETEQDAPGAFDLPGFALSGLGFAGLMYGISEGAQRGWDDTLVLASISAGVLLLGALVGHQLRRREPLLNLRLFADRLFRSTNIVVFLGTAGFLGSLYVVALFLQDGLGLSPLASGLSTFPEAIGVMLGAQVVSRLLYPVLGPRRVMAIGLLGATTMIGLMSLISDDSQLWWMRTLLFGLGVAVAHVFVPAQAASFARISLADTGRASTLFNALRQLGGAAGIAVLTSVLAGIGVVHVVDGRPAPDLTAYHVTFLVAAGLALLAAVAVLTIHDEDAASTRVARAPSARTRRRQAVAARHSPRRAEPVHTDIHPLHARSPR